MHFCIIQNRSMLVCKLLYRRVGIFLFSYAAVKSTRYVQPPLLMTCITLTHSLNAFVYVDTTAFILFCFVFVFFVFCFCFCFCLFVCLFVFFNIRTFNLRTSIYVVISTCY